MWSTRNALLLCFAWSFQCLAAPASEYIIHESRHPDSLPSRWVQKDRVEASRVLPIRVGLAQNPLAVTNGHDLLMAVADPDSPSYGKYWTSDEIVEYFKPTDDTVSAVKEWLLESGIAEISWSKNKGWLAFDIEASRAETLLHAEFYEFQDSVTNTLLPSCHEYSIPGSLRSHIDYITPGLKLIPSSPRPRIIAPDDPAPPGFDNYGTATCDLVINPDCIQALYQFNASTITSPSPKNVMGIFESLLERWDQTDLDLFFSNFTAGRIPNGTYPINKAIDGGESHLPHRLATFGHGGEVILDLDISYPIVYPQKIAIWDENDNYYQRQEIEGKANGYYAFNQLLDSIDGSYCTYSAYGETGDDPGIVLIRPVRMSALTMDVLRIVHDPQYPNPKLHGGFNGSLECGVFTPPYVLSVSYGGQEAEVTMAYQARQCNEFLKLGLQGTSIFFASGDFGVGNPPDGTGNITKSGTGCIGKDSGFRVFNPGWPSTCPYLTAVGATKVPFGSNVGEPETAANLSLAKFPEPFVSGGGFSNIYPMPKYQESAVQGYLTTYPPPYASYDKIAKIRPNPAHVDVNHLQQGNPNALFNRAGRGYPDVSANGQNSSTVVNGKAETISGTSMATPLFASLINRIVEERLAVGKSSLGFLNPALYKNPQILNDIVSGSNPSCGSAGFDTAPGWDPVTGLGTPNYPKMLDLFMSLP